MDDYILRIVKSMVEFTARLALNKEEDKPTNIVVDMSREDSILLISLKRLALQGKYNEAENMLFEELDRNPSKENYDIGKCFYELLLLRSDEELAMGNFSREEIYQGIQDIEKYKINL